MKHLDLSTINISQNTNLQILDNQESFFFKFQDLIFSPGVSYIKVKDINSGRNLLSLFYGSLKIYYNSLEFLSLVQEKINLPLINLAEQSNFQDILTHKDNAVDNYLFEVFNADCLIIEESAELKSSSWFKLLKENLVKFKFTKNISVLVFVYE